MKIGLSTYSLFRAIKAGELDLFGVIDWIAKNGGEHVEICPVGFALPDNEEGLAAIREKAKSAGIDISSYTFGAQFIQDSEQAYEEEIERILRQVKIGDGLGVKLVRHDVASRPVEEACTEQFEEDLPKLVEGCRRIADYAKELGITTSVENHGYHLQDSSRVRRLVEEVNRPNFRTTLDVGNFLCVDEDPVTATRDNIGIASMVHLKDFYVRDSRTDPGEGWIKTRGGCFLQGATLGQGELDVRSLIRIIKESSYDGYLSIEFEGMEDCRTGSRGGMETARSLLGEV